MKLKRITRHLKKGNCYLTIESKEGETMINIFLDMAKSDWEGTVEVLKEEGAISDRRTASGTEYYTFL